jgi:hypothetical protein
VVEALFPWAWWGIAIVRAIGFLIVRHVLTQWSPMTWGPRLHGLIWVIVAVGALFASAPIGVLVLTLVAIATFGRALARLRKPQSAAGFVRSPLPWAVLTILTLVGVAYNVVPPVGFPRVVVGQITGGYLARSGGGVYVVTCTPLAEATSTDERVRWVSGSPVLGGPEDRVDSGSRPSLAALAFSVLGVNGRPPTLFNADLRARRGTCAGAPPSRLSAGAFEDPALGGGVIAGSAPAGGQAHAGAPPIDSGASASASLARLYQPTLLVTVADRNWPVSVGALLADRGIKGQTTCLVQARVPQTVCSPPSLRFGGMGTASSDYLQYPVRLRHSRRPPGGLQVDSSPTGQFEPFERGQYVLEPGRRITHSVLDGWLADPGVLDPWYTAQIYFYNLGVIRSWADWPVHDANVPTGLIAFEYWFYYPYNYYPLVVSSVLMNDAPIAGDKANVDLHQGDWEHVDVLLDPATMKPRWLYMARHSNEGQFVPWSSPALSFDQGHPLIQAAFGGHPSYEPGCGPRPRTRTYNLSSDWLVCGSGRFAFRGTTTPLVDLARTAWACWPGHFGEAVPGIEASSSTNESLIVKARKFVYVQGPQAPLRQAENTGVCPLRHPARTRRRR